MRTLKRAKTLRPESMTELPFDAGAWPQVGAILRHLDSHGPSSADWRGSPRWDADGSAVLVAPRHALTIRHVTTQPVKWDDRERIDLPGMAIFFPSVGFIEVNYGWLTAGETGRDRLMLVELAEDVPLPPIPASKVERSVREPQAVGFGDWAPPKDELRPRGVQRRLCPALLHKGCTHDLCWDAVKQGSFLAGMNNSGGPVIEKKRSGYQVVGILRRTRADIKSLPNRDVVAATRVSRKRAGWVYRTLYDPFGRVARPKAPAAVQWRDFILEGPLLSSPIRLPKGTVRVHATLSASRQWVGDLFLQMRLVTGVPNAPEKLLRRLAADPRSVGEFLARGLRVRDAAAISVAIAPCTPLPGPVRAQLCLRFVNAKGKALSPPAAAVKLGIAVT